MLLGDIGGYISGVSPKVNNPSYHGKIVFEYIWYSEWLLLTFNGKFYFFPYLRKTDGGLSNASFTGIDIAWDVSPKIPKVKICTIETFVDKLQKYTPQY